MGRRSLQTARATNMTDLAAALSMPGIDPRTWVSYGVVDTGTTSVDFDDDPTDGTDGGLGPLVYVTLKPSEVDVYCRVAAGIAGDGEGEFHPFMAGDQVLVLLPQGSPTSDPVIIGKLNNATAPWPKTVGGQDASGNLFAFKRCKTPYIFEVGGSYLLKQATTSAFISFDKTGGLTIQDGGGNGLQMSADFIGLQSQDGNALLQIDISGGRAMMQVGGARMILTDSGGSPPGSSLMVPANMTIQAGGQAAAEHAISTEAVCNILANWGTTLAAAFATSFAALAAVPVTFPGTYAPAAAALAPIVAAFTEALALMAALPLAAVTPMDPALSAVIVAAFTASLPKPFAAVLGFQPAPGVGCTNIFIG